MTRILKIREDKKMRLERSLKTLKEIKPQINEIQKMVWKVKNHLKRDYKKKAGEN